MDRQALHLEGDAARSLNAPVHVLADQITRSIMISDVANDNRLVDALEEPSHLVFHSGGSEAAADAKRDAVLAHDRAHRAEYGRFFTPELTVIGLILPVVSTVGFLHGLNVFRCIVPHANRFGLAKFVDDR